MSNYTIHSYYVCHPEFLPPPYRSGNPAGHPKLLQLETPLMCSKKNNRFNQPLHRTNTMWTDFMKSIDERLCGYHCQLTGRDSNPDPRIFHGRHTPQILARLGVPTVCLCDSWSSFCYFCPNVTLLKNTPLWSLSFSSLSNLYLVKSKSNYLSFCL